MSMNISGLGNTYNGINTNSKYDLQMFYMRNMNTYLNLERQKKA